MTRARRATRTRCPILAAVVALASIGLDGTTPARAHPLAPSLLELRETAAGRFAVRWKTSAFRPTGAHLAPLLPDWCTAVGEEAVRDDAAAVDRRFTIDCGERGLRAAPLGVADLDVSRTLALLRVELADGTLLRELLDGARTMTVVPERQSRLDVARQYLELGVEHLLTGVDHLLFVLCLCLLVPGRRTLAWTITAFTAGHSVTLSLATLGLVLFPQPLAETAIAFSIVLLAAELLRDGDRAGQPAPASWIRRRPWAMASVFGLLHGLGFAGALSDVGLPQSEIPAALLAFNLGIEVGQLGFVLALLLLARLARPLFARLPERAVRVPAYAIGCLAAFWFWSRAGLVVEQLLRS